MSRHVDIKVHVDLKHLVDELADALNRDALFRLICDLDAQMADWDFTNRLVRYFDKQRKLYEAEVAADKAEAVLGDQWDGGK